MPGFADDLTRRLAEGLGELPIVDAHTHLVAGALGARGLHDVLLYHMAISDLYAAGCPSGARLTQFPRFPDEAEAHARIVEALPYLPLVRNTSISWLTRVILRDLYGWTEPVTAGNWRTLDDAIRERADDRAWHHEVLRRAGVVASSTELARRGDGQDDDLFAYALEWAFFTRCQWGEYDTALYELERCWGRPPESPTPIGAGGRPATERTVRSLDDVHAAVEHYVGQLAEVPIVATATHISTDLDLRRVSDDEMAAAISRREEASEHERDVYASYINEAFLTAMERRAAHVVFQFSYGAEPLPFETGSRLTQRSIAQVAEMVSGHPGLRFQCYLASRHANQSLCTLCRELPNLSLSGYWWHNFFPSAVRQVIDERLDMLPVNKQIGFFSDAYCAEWVYGKACLVKAQLAEALAMRVRRGQHTVDEALGVARAILHDTPAALLGAGPGAKPKE